MGIKLDLSAKQYAALVKLVHLGNFMVNSFRTDSSHAGKTGHYDKSGKRLAEYDDLEQYVLSLAEEAGFGRRVVKDAKSENLLLSETLEDEVHQYSKRYDDDVFWDTLVDLMAARDMREAHTKEEIAGMDDDEYFSTLDKYTRRYEQEFNKHGIDRLQIEKD